MANEAQSLNSIPDVYINSVECGFTPFDIISKLGLTGSIDGVSHILNLRMSPQHAKVFAAILAENVAEYEKKIGKIALPKDIEKNLGLT